jgi:hypothetical protein
LRIASLVPPPAEADAAVLAAVIRDSGADTEVPGPGGMEYVAVVVSAAVEWMWDRAQPLGSLFGLGRGTAVVVASAFVGVVLVGAVWIGVRVFVGRRRHRLAADPATAGSGPPPPAFADAAEWLRELDRRLEAGDVAGALEALWWFVARSVASGEVRPSWTSGELLARARRHDLRPLAVQLDRFRYGPRGPASSDVRELAARLGRALA